MNSLNKIFFAVLSVSLLAACGAVKGENAAGKNELPDGKDKSVVYFTEDISPEGLVKIYGKINENIKGKTAIKVHTGEPHGPNIIPRDMVKALQKIIPQSNLVETNTYYKGGRYTTEDHLKTIKKQTAGIFVKSISWTPTGRLCCR